MTLKGGTSQACAACKYQRRRCTSECPLAPYFPADQPKLFQNAHKLFGVSNILKILKKLEPEHKATAMWSIIYQANERERDPVHGCLGKICQLRYQIWHMEQELLSVHAQIDMCRQHQQQQQQQQQIPLHHDQSQLELVMAPPNNNNNNDNNTSYVLPHPFEPALIENNDNIRYNENNITNSNNNDEKISMVDGNINPLWVQYPYTNDNNNGNTSMVVHPTQFIAAQNPNHHHHPHHHDSQPLDIQQEVVQDYDEMPFFDNIDDIDPKEAYESSSEDNLVDNELKNAAACLSLTSVN